ncbi:hypothetical protein EMQ25_04920 [Arsenicitalea aurantiaca]|uniref:Aldose 1-epimerase n=1 Tax=Arsenicitalea aurantiaca TaxID=1783274 RepID=A0A433XEI7_9HYPH|nr:hypothetical protein [Arsenicitalea aurantiaca]RUT32503.1 hypothetical protein EMQ25_04920 [Arsenicitalea aurantiaca]
MGEEYRGLGWKHGALVVQRQGAMLAPITFLLANGAQVSPMHVGPWAEEAGMEALPGILRRLRGEWPCVPFGYAVPGDDAPEAWARHMTPPAPDEEVHGLSSNVPWTWGDCDAETLRLSLDYPEADPVRRLERIVTPDPSAPAVDVELRIEIRHDCRLPIGLHPTFHLPAEAGGATLEPGKFDHGRTYPGTVEPGATLFAMDETFADLSAVPGRAGGTRDATTLPFAEDIEELLQLNGVAGTMALANRAEGYRVRLSWQPEHFPSVLLWYSNRGRKMAPWSGRNVSLGIEPICSPFGLGIDTAQADNPVAASGTPTARDFVAGETFVTRYRIEAEPI